LEHGGSSAVGRGQAGYLKCMMMHGIAKFKFNDVVIKSTWNTERDDVVIVCRKCKL
jgi:hypothetical protein